MNKVIASRKPEQGSAGIKLLVFLAILFLVGYAGYNYVPVAYEAQSFKQEMQTAIIQGQAPQPNMTIPDTIKLKIQKAMASNNIPLDAVIQVKQTPNSVQAHVSYSKQIPILPFGMYKYKYNFDHTATPVGFLLKED